MTGHHSVYGKAPSSPPSSKVKRKDHPIGWPFFLVIIIQKGGGAGHSEIYRWRDSDFPPRRILRIYISVPSTYKYTYM